MVTRLIGVSPQNVITIKGDLEHMTMMNDGSLQKQIAKLLSPGPHALRRMRAQAKTMKTNTASRAELTQFLNQLRGVAVKPGLDKEQRDQAIRKFLQQFGPDQLQELFARAYLDALKSPSQKVKNRGGRKNPVRRAETGANDSDRIRMFDSTRVARTASVSCWRSSGINFPAITASSPNLDKSAPHGSLAGASPLACAVSSELTALLYRPAPCRLKWHKPAQPGPGGAPNVRIITRRCAFCGEI